TSSDPWESWFLSERKHAWREVIEVRDDQIGDARLRSLASEMEPHRPHPQTMRRLHVVAIGVTDVHRRLRWRAERVERASIDPLMRFVVPARGGGDDGCERVREPPIGEAPVEIRMVDGIRDDRERDTGVAECPYRLMDAGAWPGIAANRGHQGID